MAVQILHDPERAQAVMTCTTSDWAFGPVFTPRFGWDAEEHLQAFLRWLPEFQPVEGERVSLGPRGYWHRGAIDPRELTDAGMIRACTEWLELNERRVLQAAPSLRGA